MTNEMNDAYVRYRSGIGPRSERGYFQYSVHVGAEMCLREQSKFTSQEYPSSSKMITT